MQRPATRKLTVVRVHGVNAEETDDLVVVEEPLELRLAFREGQQRVSRNLTLTMRTPGDDAALAAGLLFTEGIIERSADILELQQTHPNVVRIELANTVAVDGLLTGRSLRATASCGICGKTSLAAVATLCESALPADEPKVTAEQLCALPDRLALAQGTFRETGGLHAAALFSVDGELLNLREDIGRHNALDKLIGHEFLAGRVPLRNGVVLLSSRTSFEMLNKTIRAGIPILAAIGAPSSMAVELAEEYGVTLIGFLRGHRFNIYSRAGRISV